MQESPDFRESLALLGSWRRQCSLAVRLVIKSLPADAVSPPTSDQVQAIVEAARKRALDYGKTLPNFLCVEVTNRSVDASGNAITCSRRAQV